MKKDRFIKNLFILLASVLAFTACGGSKQIAVERAANKQITILAVNDMHAAVDNFPRFAFMVDSLRGLYPDLLLVSAGDNQTGNPVNDQYPEKGLPMIELMNALSFDLSAIGNHEFDSSAEGLSNLLGKANFDFICANVMVPSIEKFPIKPYKIITNNIEKLEDDIKKLIISIDESESKYNIIINIADDIDIKLDDAILNEQHVNIPFVGPDNYKASYEVGKLLVGSLRRGDEVAIIEGLPSADNASQRKAGSLRVIQEEGYKLVASEPANWETADARNAFSRIWSQNPDLKGVFCGNDAMALGVLQEMDIQRKYLPVVGFDNDGVMLPYLRKGQEIGTVDIFSSQMAVEGIRYAINMIRQGLRTYDSYSTPFKIICGGSSCGLS